MCGRAREIHGAGNGKCLHKERRHGWRKEAGRVGLEQAQKEEMQPGCPLSPCRLKSCEENKVYCLERGWWRREGAGWGEHVKSTKAIEVNN